MCRNYNLQNFGNGCGACSCRKKLFAFVACWVIMLFMLVIGWDDINNMLVDCIVAHLLNRFCMCFGYVPISRNFGVSCFDCWDNIALVQYSLGVQYCGDSFIERLWGMKVRMLLMFFVFLMDTSLSHLVSFFYSTVQNKKSGYLVYFHWLFG